jgi:hypothetical protein
MWLGLDRRQEFLLPRCFIERGRNRTNNYFGYVIYDTHSRTRRTADSAAHKQATAHRITHIDTLPTCTHALHLLLGVREPLMVRLWWHCCAGAAWQLGAARGSAHSLLNSLLRPCGIDSVSLRALSISSPTRSRPHGPWRHHSRRHMA